MCAFVLHDRCFDPVAERISAYFCQLFVLPGKNFIRYCLLDTDKNTFISLAAYKASSASEGHDNLMNNLDQLFREDETPFKKYPTVIIGLDTPWHTLVPASLFKEEEIQNILRFNFKSIPADAVMAFDEISEENTVNIFAFTRDQDEAIKRFFPGSARVHTVSTLLRSFSRQQRLEAGSASVFLNLRGNRAELACFEKGRLVFFNTFTVQGAEDILYFTLYAIGQAYLKADAVTLVVSGEIDPEDETCILLRKYLGKVHFAGRPATFNYSPLICQLPEHSYHDLFSLALCGS
jgi:hypothetical protein